MTAWVLRNPFGNLVPGTLAEDKQWAEQCAFDYLYSHTDEAWAKNYWKRWDPFIKARKRRGWEVVRVKLVETDERTAQSVR